MPKYNYVCDVCGWSGSKVFPMHNIPQSIECELVLSHEATRRFTSPQLNTRPLYLSDEWRPTAEESTPEARRASDKAYEAKWLPPTQQELDIRAKKMEALAKDG